jgi:hypothetical protein
MTPADAYALAKTSSSIIEQHTGNKDEPVVRKVLGQMMGMVDILAAQEQMKPPMVAPFEMM